MKLMSFNIRYGSANDGANSWEKRKDILFQLIETQNPDILGLQEVEYFQLQQLLEKFPFYRTVGTSRNGDIHSGEINPILFRETQFSTQSGTFWLSDKPYEAASKSYGNRLPRICTWSEFNLNESGDKFYVYNTHLDHESSNARVEGSKQILDFIGEKERVIIMGDFNSFTVDSDEVTQITKRNFIDAFAAVHPKNKYTPTFHGFSGKAHGTRIDYIFIRGFQVTDSEIIKECNNGRYPSDHFPITAIVNL